MLPAGGFFAKYLDTDNVNYLWFFIGNLFFVIFCFLTKLLVTRVNDYKNEIKLLKEEVTTLTNINESLTSNNIGLKQNLDEKENQLVEHEADMKNLYAHNIKLNKYMHMLLEHIPPEGRTKVSQIIEMEQLIDGGSDHGRI